MLLLEAACKLVSPEQLVRQRRALWGAFVQYEYKELGFCYNTSIQGSLLFTDGPSQALHLQVAFPPDDYA